MDADAFVGYDRQMKLLALLILLASPALGASTDAVQSPTPDPGSLQSSRIRLDAHDAAGALADAETVLAHGGGADAFAARADAKRALGRPINEVIADYAEATKLDPRYIEKYKGLIAQRDAEAHPGSNAASSGKGLNGTPIAGIVAAGLVGVLLVGFGFLLARRGVK